MKLISQTLTTVLLLTIAGVSTSVNARNSYHAFNPTLERSHNSTKLEGLSQESLSSSSNYYEQGYSFVVSPSVEIKRQQKQEENRKRLQYQASNGW